jgi:hypothetical protein
MVTDPDVPAAPANRAVIGEWLARWTPLALAAAGGLAVLFDDIPSGRSSFEQAAEHAMDVHERALAAAGLEPYGGPR